jgi:hypothetical protein
VSVKYLLPCRCGQQVVVEPREAGETTVCSCGQSLSIPTFLEMSALERAPEETMPTTGSAWGWTQRIVLLGAMLLLTAIAVGVLAYKTRPIAPIDVFDPEAVQRGIKDWPPGYTWWAWENMKQMGLIQRSNPKYESAVVLFRVEEATAVVLTLAGIALVALGMKKKGVGEGERTN